MKSHWDDFKSSPTLIRLSAVLSAALRARTHDIFESEGGDQSLVFSPLPTTRAIINYASATQVTYQGQDQCIAMDVFTQGNMGFYRYSIFVGTKREDFVLLLSFCCF